MRARVPLDVDLQDRLMYGLTPGRFACLVAGLVLALVSCQTLAAPVFVRAPLALVALAVGAALAWLRIAGRTLDAWALDWTRFVLRSHRLEFRSFRAPRIGLLRRVTRPSSRSLIRVLRRDRSEAREPKCRARGNARVTALARVAVRTLVRTVVAPLRPLGLALRWLLEPLTA